MSNVTEGISALRQLSKMAKSVAVKRLAALDEKLAEITNLENVAKQFEERGSKAKRDAKTAETKLSTIQNTIDSGNEQIAKQQDVYQLAVMKSAKFEKEAFAVARKKADDIVQGAHRRKADVEELTIQARAELGNVKHEIERANKELVDTNAKISAIKEQARAALK